MTAFPTTAAYVCSCCGREFETGWNNEDASAEFVARHGRRPDPLLDNVVCDDCHKMIVVWIGTREMTRHELLEWLAKEDTSLYGECKGALLTELMSDGCVVVDHAPPGRSQDYARVRLTQKGFDELRLDDELGGL